jgi:hypothetical protein
MADSSSAVVWPLLLCLSYLHGREGAQIDMGVKKCSGGDSFYTTSTHDKHIVQNA